MADRQTRNVSLPPHQSAFVDELVAKGRYRTASEVVRDGLRLLEEAEHRRLLEKWIYDGLGEEEEQLLPEEVKERAVAWFRTLVDEAQEDVEQGRVDNGPTAMQGLRDKLRKRME